LQPLRRARNGRRDESEQLKAFPRGRHKGSSLWPFRRLGPGVLTAILINGWRALRLFNSKFRPSAKTLLQTMTRPAHWPLARAAKRRISERIHLARLDLGIDEQRQYTVEITGRRKRISGCWSCRKRQVEGADFGIAQAKSALHQRPSAVFEAKGNQSQAVAKGF
jgi:hypothetical protein